MNAIVVENRYYFFETKEDLLGPEFQELFSNHKSRPVYMLYCDCRGNGTERVELEIFRMSQSGIYYVRHVKGHPHQSNCPLYQDPSGVSQSEKGLLYKAAFSDEAISFDEWKSRSEIVRSALAKVARYAHDKLGWRSFADRHSMADWDHFQVEVKKEFYALPTKDKNSVLSYLEDLDLTFYCGIIDEAGNLTKLSMDSPNSVPIFIRTNPKGHNSRIFPKIVSAGFRGAMDYCKIYDEYIQGPYLLLALVNSKFVITRCVLLPICVHENRVAIVESHQERLLMKRLLGLHTYGWIKPIDSGFWLSVPAARELLKLDGTESRLPRMDFVARIEQKIVIIEHFGFDNPKYNRLRVNKLQFACEHYLPKEFIYWDSAFKVDFQDKSNRDKEDFEIHEYRSDRPIEKFKLCDIDYLRYED